MASLVLSGHARADIVWETDYNQARAKSLATGKPLLVDVYTEWCGWCKKLDSSVYPDARVQQLSKNFVMLRLNAEGGGASFARTMKVTGYPTLIFATARGQQVARRDGYIEPGYFVADMQETLRANGPIRPQRATSTRRFTNGKRRTRQAPRRATSSRARPQSVATVAQTWKRAPEVRPAIRQPGYGGAYILGDGGLVAVEAPAKNNRTSKATKKSAVSVR